MKKFFTLMALTLITVMGWAQIPVKVQIDDPSRVESMTFAEAPITFDAAGKCEFTAEKPGYLIVNLKSPWKFTSTCTYTEHYQAGGDPYMGTLYCSYNSYVSSWIGDAGYYSAYEFVLTTFNMDDARTNEATVTVHGKPEKVQLQLSGTNWSKSDFVEGDNTVKFMDDEKTFTIGSAKYPELLYEVYLNGTKQESQYQQWSFDVANGDKIDVYTEYPDKDVTVTIKYAGDASAEAIQYVKIGNEEQDFTKPISAKAGQTITFQPNTSVYTPVYIKVNGVEQPNMYSYSAVLTEDIEIEVNLTKKATYKATVTVDDCSHIKYMLGYGDYKFPTANTFDVEIAQDDASWSAVLLEPVDYNYAIVEVTLDGVKVDPYEWDKSKYYVYLTESAKEITVKTEAVVRDRNWAFYFDSPSKINDSSLNLYGWSMSCDVLSRQFHNENIFAGYNVIPFADIDGTFKFTPYGPFDPDVKNNVHVYLNNEEYNPAAGETDWKMQFNDGDVFKVYVSPTAPATHTVTFSATAATAVESAYVDRIKSFVVTDGLKMENELPGTEYKITLAAGYILLVNGTEPASDGGVYTFVCNEDSEVKIDSATGINAAKATVSAQPAYNLSGARVSGNARQQELRIQNSRKFIVK